MTGLLLACLETEYYVFRIGIAHNNTKEKHKPQYSRGEHEHHPPCEVFLLHTFPAVVQFKSSECWM